MIKQFLITMLATVLFAAVCVAGVVGSKTAAIWGVNSCDAQLSIGVSNDVVRADSTAIFYTRTKNLSTNLVEIMPKYFASYTLTNRLGKIYQAVPVIPTVTDANPPRNLDVSPGEIREWSVQIKFDKKMEPGDYVFSQITEDIKTVDGKVCTLTSNLLKVKVVK